MTKPQTSLADLSAVLRAARTARVKSADSTGHMTVEVARREIADFCRYIGSRLSEAAADAPTVKNNSFPTATTPAPPAVKLSPRMKQTLDRLLVGDSEKQIASNLGLSQHTVHVYIKEIYKRFDVSSRGELLARFVRVPALT